MRFSTKEDPNFKKLVNAFLDPIIADKMRDKNVTKDEATVNVLEEVYTQIEATLGITTEDLKRQFYHFVVDCKPDYLESFIGMRPIDIMAFVTGEDNKKIMTVITRYVQLHQRTKQDRNYRTNTTDNSRYITISRQGIGSLRLYVNNSILWFVTEDVSKLFGKPLKDIQDHVDNYNMAIIDGTEVINIAGVFSVLERILDFPEQDSKLYVDWLVSEVIPSAYAKGLVRETINTELNNFIGNLFSVDKGLLRLFP